MDEGETQFARDLLRLFGEDRFYHALLRLGQPREAKMMHTALGGTEEGWIRTCRELRLGGVGSERNDVRDRTVFAEGEPGDIICRVACTLSSHFKEYAMRSPALPAPIHARMLLDRQNEWTRKYAENLARHAEGK